MTWFWLGLPTYFVALWLLITGVIAAISGLSALAARFPDRPEAPLAVFRPQEVRVGVARLRGRVVTLAACPTGVRLSLNRAFAPFTRPALVPWTQVRAEPSTRGTILHVAGVPIRLPIGAAERLLNHRSDSDAQSGRELLIS